MDHLPPPPPAMIEPIETTALESPHGLITLEHGAARCTVSLHGANVISYQPTPEIGEVIWTGGYLTEPGKDCWGGIPLVWPWFMMGQGESPKGPFHGVARFATWKVVNYQAGDDQTDTVLTLGLSGPLAARNGSPIPLEAELVIALGESLKLTLHTVNRGTEPYPLEHCYHAYFKVGDVTQITIGGLEGTELQDNRAGGARQAQQGQVTLDGPAARIFRPFPNSVVLHDPVLTRTLTLISPEATQLVLWNSGPVRTENGNQTGEPEWQTQLALEPLQGLEHQQLIAPGESSQLTLEIQAEASE